MKNHSHILIIILPCICYMLTACDPAIGYKYYVKNNTEKEITVFYKGLGFNDTTVNMKIVPKTEVLLFETSLWGSNPHDEKENFLYVFDTLSITFTDSSILVKDYLHRDNWKYSNDINYFGFIKVGTNIYEIEIVNQDIQYK